MKGDEMMEKKELRFEDVKVGDEITPLVKGPITRSQIVRYAGASGDFNPIHIDEEFAEKVNLGGVIAHGMLSMAFAAQMMSDWLGVNGTLKKLKVRFIGMVRPGDTLTFKGKVTKKYVRKKEKYIACDIYSENQREEKTLTEQAVATLP
jgi:acyl dehydratase